MKVFVDKDELWPNYTLSVEQPMYEGIEEEVDMPAELFAEYQTAYNTFQAARTKLIQFLVTNA
jgi:hypothetical protein